MTTEIAIPGLNLVANADMVIDDAKLDEVSAQSDTGVKSRVVLPNMNLFHTTPHNDSIHPEGSWVLGMTKHKDGALKGQIDDQGKLVIAFTILGARKQWNYFNDKDLDNACESNFFVDFKEDIKGYEHGHACGKKGTCPFIKKEGDPKDKKGCTCQIVVLGKAHCADGSVMNARFYAKGSAFMATSELLDTGFKIVTQNGVKNIECFMAPVMLSSDGPHFQGTVKYFKPVYNIPATYPTDQWDGLLNESKGAVDYFKKTDAHKSAKDAPQEAVEQAYVAPAQQAYVAPQTVVNPPIDGGDPVAEAQKVLADAQAAAAQAVIDAQAQVDAQIAQAAQTATPVAAMSPEMSMEEKLKAIMNPQG